MVEVERSQRYIELRVPRGIAAVNREVSPIFSATGHRSLRACPDASDASLDFFILPFSKINELQSPQGTERADIASGGAALPAAGDAGRRGAGASLGEESGVTCLAKHVTPLDIDLDPCCVTQGPIVTPVWRGVSYIGHP